ncbi:tripartite-type tricarboxylate transporter receptor subunit TctC [Bosea sp. BE125]|uniref:tripartite tricarboxylate transporter substrate-binding protein n=1 Tax=Bosea sp. BE125 TaxID=2817909 RepID=UPI00285C44BB|nr:tripartite tricarboxylate transporter substrate-binding protein [Bosea sp. BE125]MDR6873061.1 tripartite-type tricarboxylate transporter receptor subunit TctC [Bosea sp. BE125]
MPKTEIILAHPVRSTLYPDAPTIAESGFPGFEAQGWFRLSAPAGTRNRSLRS